MLVRANVGGCTHSFASDCHDAGIRFSIAHPVDEPIREQILEAQEGQWVRAVDSDGGFGKGVLDDLRGERLPAHLAGRPPALACALRVDESRAKPA
jgi:hypothetical protein